MQCDPFPLSRRQLLFLAGTALGIAATDGDFWNTKPPAEWLASDIYRLMNDSPWAVSTNWWEIPENGWLTEDPRRSGPKVVVTWAGAQPICDALKNPPRPGDAPFYVIGVDGIPPEGLSRGDMKRLAVLRSSGKPKWNVRAAVAREVIRNSSIYEFGFPKPAAPIGADTVEVSFEIDFGTQTGFRGMTHAQQGVQWSLQAKFKPKDMMYHGKLAL
jgi:hypothetical protein